MFSPSWKSRALPTQRGVQTECDLWPGGPRDVLCSELVSAGSWRVTLQSVSVFVCVFVCCVSLSGLQILWGSSFWVSAQKYLRVEAQCYFVSSSLDFVSECWSRWILLKSKTVRVERKFYAGVILGRGFHFVYLTCSNGLLWSNELEFRSEDKKMFIRRRTRNDFRFLSKPDIRLNWQ